MQVLGAIVHVWGSKKLKFMDTKMFFRFAKAAGESFEKSNTWSTISMMSSMSFRPTEPGNSIGKMKTVEQHYKGFAKEKLCNIDELASDAPQGSGELRFRSMKYNPFAHVPTPSPPR